jgi:DNA-binding HxlR family transcriptional regulator
MKNSGKAIKMTAMRSPCPIANALDIFGDKWTLLVLRDLFTGKSTFGDFQSSPEGIPTNILADRLKRLQAHGLIDKKPYQQRPLRYAYELTKAGRSLGPVLKEIINWGKNNIAGTQARMKIQR